MVRVCQEWFPKTNGFDMDERLVMQIEVLLRNIKNDWDFTILVTGQGEVRVGKSMIAMQIAAYWAYEIWKRFGIKVPFSEEDNFVFDGKKLIEIGNKLGKSFPYSPLVFDEAGADLEGRKSMQTQTQDVLDYYRECGQYNMLNILVLPEYFDLPKGIALTRSIFLIDVFYLPDKEAVFQRGYFNFYSRRSKKWLYLLGKKDLNYSKVHSDFGRIPGKFVKFYPIDEDKYKEAKQQALIRRESKRRNKFQLQRDACWYLLTQEFGVNQNKLGERMEGLTGIYVAQQTISDGIAHFKAENN